MVLLGVGGVVRGLVVMMLDGRGLHRMVMGVMGVVWLLLLLTG